MILIFGGTTEGRIVTKLLDYTGDSYFYSTKIKTKQEVGGTIINGEMNSTDIQLFISKQNIKLIIDAAHPFAIQLHENISQSAIKMGIATIRYERIFPDLTQDGIRLFNSYEKLIKGLYSSNYNKILALTGVQTIPLLKDIWRKKQCYFRILNREKSIQLAKKSGIPSRLIIAENPNNKTSNIVNLAKDLNIELIITKESGHSGQIDVKLEAAKQLKCPLWVVKRPVLPKFDELVSSEKEFLKVFYPLRRSKLKIDDVLRTGLTTGSCITACVKACFFALITKEFPKKISIKIPSGEEATFLIFNRKIKEAQASCTVVKDAGDDPDITHGKEIGCILEIKQEAGIEFRQGEGIGLVTLPGLELAIGEPAINKMPRKMITEILNYLAEEYTINGGFIVTPFIPEGRKLAKQTFNERVGVKNGLSILGTSGKVIPYSHEAFVDTIKKQFAVLKAQNITEVMLTSGKRSENFLKENYSHLPSTAFIHFGNSVGESLKIAVESGVKIITLALMFGKATKLAEGHLNTHSSKVKFNPTFIQELAMQLKYSQSVCEKIGQQKIANAILDFIPFSPTEKLYKYVAFLCYKNCVKVINDNIAFEFVLLSTDGKPVRYSCPDFEN